MKHYFFSWEHLYNAFWFEQTAKNIKFLSRMKSITALRYVKRLYRKHGRQSLKRDQIAAIEITGKNSSRDRLMVHGGLNSSIRCRAVLSRKRGTMDVSLSLQNLYRLCNLKRSEPVVQSAWFRVLLVISNRVLRTLFQPQRLNTDVFLPLSADGGKSKSPALRAKVDSPGCMFFGALETIA